MVESRSNGGLQIGTVLAGRYRIETVLGTGGMGRVFGATHVVLNKQVVVKALLPDVLKYPNAIERFMQEAQLTSQLGNQHICPVYDAQTDPVSGIPYMVMDRLYGETLGDRIERFGRLPLQQAIRIMAQVCDGLGAAHRAGVVHRDIKPANVFLCEDEASEFVVKLLDFGIAKLGELRYDVQVSARVFDRTEDMFGTPLYMAPEAIRCNVDIDQRVDIWALGVMFYEMLTGQHPFAGDRLTLHEVITSIMVEEPVDVGMLAPELPANVVAVIRQALEKDHDKRPPDCESLMEPLAEYLPERAPAYAPPDPALVRLLEDLTRERDRMRRKKTAVGGYAPNETERQSLEAEIRTAVEKLSKARPPREGDLVAGARLIDIVGKGNFGTVWRAKDPTSNELRAVKVFDRDRMGLGLSLYHFRRGVRVMKHLNASQGFLRSIVRLHGADSANLSLCMDFLPGGDLSEIGGRRWDIQKKLAVFRVLCAAVRFAHENGVLHRDIKPENVLMSADDCPVLTDFDIAELLFTKTLSAQAGGTQIYAAPEQLAGKGKRSPAGDVYSLGRMLEYMLTERDPPIRIEPIPRLAEIANSVELGFTRIIRKCTCKEPDMRYLTVGALLKDLDLARQAPETVGLGAADRPLLGMAAELSASTAWTRAEELAAAGEFEEAFSLSERAMACMDALEDAQNSLLERRRTRRKWKIAAGHARFAAATVYAGERNWSAACAACDAALALVKDQDDRSYGRWKDAQLRWLARSGDWNAICQVMRQAVTTRRVPLALAFALLVLLPILLGLLVKPLEDRATNLAPVSSAESTKVGSGSGGTRIPSKLRASSAVPMLSVSSGPPRSLDHEAATSLQSPP